jgi:alpha,alpha-trehalose phosphorylase
MDLHDLEHNTRDGVHIASLAGAWLALACGFGGLRPSSVRPGSLEHSSSEHSQSELGFAPVLPQGLTKLTFRLQVKGNTLKVQVSPGSTRYELSGGDPLSISHHGEQLQVGSDQPQHRPNPRPTPRLRPAQPPGREPARRGPTAAGSPG